MITIICEIKASVTFFTSPTLVHSIPALSSSSVGIVEETGMIKEEGFQLFCKEACKGGKHAH